MHRPPDPTDMKSLRTLLGTLVVALLTAGCAFEGDYPQSSISPTSDFARVIHELYVDIFWWTVLILAVVWVALAYILVRFRARRVCHLKLWTFPWLYQCSILDEGVQTTGAIVGRIVLAVIELKRITLDVDGRRGREANVHCVEVGQGRLPGAGRPDALRTLPGGRMPWNSASRKAARRRRSGVT